MSGLCVMRSKLPFFIHIIYLAFSNPDKQALFGQNSQSLSANFTFSRGWAKIAIVLRVGFGAKNEL
jgi:hypothetical protein